MGDNENKGLAPWDPGFQICFFPRPEGFLLSHLASGKRIFLGSSSSLWEVVEGESWGKRQMGRRAGYKILSCSQKIKKKSKIQ